jgi:uncharacterized membrane protein
MSKTRVASIDILRGIIMVIMALDHVRDFLHAQVTPDGHDFQNPTDLMQTTPFLFFTRFITHYCAPTFVLLTGTSAYLIGQRKSKKDLSSFLIKRGIWLVLVELLLMSLAFSFDPLYHVLFLQVIWVIGWSMIILGLMIWLPYPVILVTGLVLFFGHNYLDQINLPDNVKNSPLGMVLYYSYNFMITLSPDRVIIVLYALIPWLGVMLLGYCLGKLYESGVEASRRRKVLTGLGIGLLLFFFVFRYFNIYGDQVPWKEQPRGTVYSIISFFNVTKYPASLLFYCVTLGCSLLVLSALENINNGFTRVMNVFGRVPFFYYIIHFYTIHIVTVVVFYLQGYGTKDIVPQGMPFLFRPPTLGFPLWGVYIAWFLLMVALYPLCKKYDRYKSTHTQWWLSYL